MAIIILQNIWDKQQYPWGWQVRADFLDEATGRIYNEIINFPAEPIQVDIDAAISARQAILSITSEPIIAEDGTFV